MDIKRILAGPLVMLAIALPQAVSAEDFTFNVPVNFSNIHEDVDEVRVSCKVFKGQTVTTEGIIGNKIERIDRPGNGNFNTTVQVKFNANSNKNRSDAENYKCELHVGKGSIGSYVRPGSNTVFCKTPSDDWRCTKEGTTYQNPSAGPIP